MAVGKKDALRVAVIGAGMAGITCAQKLRESGLSPVVFEKSKAIGGRMSTRVIGPDLTFDHGAQYVRGKSPAFLKVLNQLEAAGSIQPWTPRARAGENFDPTGVKVGAPEMRVFSAPCAEGLDIRFNTEVLSLSQSSDGFVLNVAGEEMAFDQIVSTVPVVQAKRLFGGFLDGQLDPVEMAPCWALMVGFDDPLPVDFDVWRKVNESVGWLARNGTKPGRSDAETWVVHASPDWSLENLERDKHDVAPDLLAIFFDALGIAPVEPNILMAHRWRYAQTTKPLGQNYLDLAEGNILVGGDWCLGARVEFAFQSGLAMAENLVSRTER